MVLVLSKLSAAETAVETPLSVRAPSLAVPYFQNFTAAATALPERRRLQLALVCRTSSPSL